jgi:CO dehydrogenase maturation factor
MKNNKAFIVAICGKGGVGKTSLAALLLDELARRKVAGPVLAVDGDPASTLYLALGLPAPAATLAQVRETTPLNARTVRNLPAGVTPVEYVAAQMQEAGVIGEHSLREMPLHLLTMGQGEGPGCYCSINRALSTVLESLTQHYPIILVDGEAGLEHLSRYRLGQVDLLLVVSTPSRAAQIVAGRIVQTAHQVGMAIGQAGMILNRAPVDLRPKLALPILTNIPDSAYFVALERLGLPVVELPDGNPVRASLKPVVDSILVGG